jgi:site-specific DNA recombinase
MKSYFAYIRVSTAKQGTQGVSLVEQRSAIERYAAHTNLSIVEWFEERQTAAKRGRAVFNRMLALLRKGKAHGVIIHKIDRSARNLRDWADLGDLIDAGVDVHFAADALDLSSRGGRLSADIQAVVAADYIRNLREETRKGFYGRLKQGLFPLAAPFGYLDQGGGKPKVPNPRTAPAVRLIFQLYGSGHYSLRALCKELADRNIRNTRGEAISINALSKVLNNPFYCGIIRLRRTKETFRGVHEPIVSVAHFQRVQNLLSGKCGPKTIRHEHLFRQMIRCGCCNKLLVGEQQKGRTYYRCHSPSCPPGTVRDDRIEQAVLQVFETIQLGPKELVEARECLSSAADQKVAINAEAQRNVELSLANAKARLERLTDALLDGVLDRVVFDERREGLLTEIARLEEAAATPTDRFASLLKALELSSSLISSYISAEADEKRGILNATVSNFLHSGKKLAIEPREPFLGLSQRHLVSTSAPQRDTARTKLPGTASTIRTWLEREIKTLADVQATTPPRLIRRSGGDLSPSSCRTAQRGPSVSLVRATGRNLHL